MSDIPEATLNKIANLANALGCTNIKLAQMLKELKQQGEISNFSIYNKHIWVYPYTGNGKLMVFGHYDNEGATPICHG